MVRGSFLIKALSLKRIQAQSGLIINSCYYHYWCARNNCLFLPGLPSLVVIYV